MGEVPTITPSGEHESSWRYIEYDDLDEIMDLENQAAYTNGLAVCYINTYERRPAAAAMAEQQVVVPVTTTLREYFPTLAVAELQILCAGTGSGLHQQLFAQRGHPTLGIDASGDMIEQATAYQAALGPLPGALLHQLSILRMEDLASAALSQVHGIVVESALAHVKNLDLPAVLRNMYELLYPLGVALLNFRSGTGSVYHVQDQYGVHVRHQSGTLSSRLIANRYFTSHSAPAAVAAVTQAGFSLLSQTLHPHPDPTRPAFHSILAQKQS